MRIYENLSNIIKKDSHFVKELSFQKSNKDKLTEP